MRYLVFATNKNIKVLTSYELIDGTLKSCLNNFYQVYTVHCFVDGTTLHVYMPLLPDKRQETYNSFWSNLKTDIVSPNSITINFERACNNSVSDNFPEQKLKVVSFKHSTNKKLERCKTPEDIKNYFADTFEGEKTQNSTRRKYRFDIDMWNVYFRTIGDLPKTNISLEGFNRGFESMLQMSNPDRWKFI